MTEISQNNYRILVIDDNLDVHEDFKKILRTKNQDLDNLGSLLFEDFEQPNQLPPIELEFASQGQQGLECVQLAKLNDKPYAMAFVDVRMPPGWDGIYTISKLWQADPDLEVVICTAFSDLSWQEIITKLGHTSEFLILKKPFDSIEICQLACSLSNKWTLKQRGKKYLDNIVESVADLLIVIDSNNRIKLVNKNTIEITGFTESELKEKLITDLLKTSPLSDYQHLSEQRVHMDKRNSELFNASINEIKSNGSIRNTEKFIFLKNGTSIPVLMTVSTMHRDDENDNDFIIALTDMTEIYEKRISLMHQATHDDLTGLANRACFTHEIKKQIQIAKRDDDKFAVAFIDLDRFKFVNDSLGHQAGNELLIEIAKRLKKRLRAGDFASRLSGDEFALILGNLKDEKSSIHIIQRLLDDIGKPVSVGEKTIRPSCSLGISFYPQDSDNEEGLLKKSDIAMYRAKEFEGRSFQYFKPAMQEDIKKRLALEEDLKLAIERDEFFLLYQPKIDLFNGTIIGVETIVRWQHPERGILPPNHFIGPAEEFGLIVTIGNIIFEKVCRQLRQWADKGFEARQVAVNLTAVQFMADGIEIKISELLSKYKIPAKLIELEVTETVSMAHPKKSIEIMERFSSMGLSLAINDFGAGNSNLPYLRLCPVGLLKIDVSFIRGIVDTPTILNVTKTIIEIGHTLGMKVMAEGVEVVEQLKLLQKNGCDLIQGSLISPPLIATDFERFCHNFKYEDMDLEKSHVEVSVLIVGDDPLALNSIAKKLKKIHSSILFAESIESANRVFSKNEIGLIIFFHNLCSHKETDSFSNVKNMYPNSFRILLTVSKDEHTDHEEIQYDSIHHHLTKPWNNEELVNVSQGCLREYLSIRSNEMSNNGRL